MLLQEFLNLCLDCVWKEEPRQVVEVKFEDLTRCSLLQSIKLLVLSK